MLVDALIAFFAAALPIALLWRLTRKLEGLEELAQLGLRLRPLAPHETDISRRLGAALARRAFASGDGIVFGSCDPLGCTELVSARDGELYVSERSERQAGLAVSPFVSARHFGPGMTSLEQYVQQAQHARLREIAWRDAQDPDALLDLDLRALLGERTFAVLGSELTVRLAARRGVTTARVVSSKD